MEEGARHRQWGDESERWSVDSGLKRDQLIDNMRKSYCT